MDSIAPWDAGKLVHAVMGAWEHGDPTQPSVLIDLAERVRLAGPIDRVALILERDGVLCLFGPYGRGGAANQAGIVLQTRDAELTCDALPGAPTCVASPDASVPLEAVLCAMGLASFTLLPLVDAKPLAAIVLGHPDGEAPCESVRMSAEVLGALGRRIGSSLRLRQMGILPPVSDAMRSIALIGRMASLGTIAGGLIHEINNPATFIALAGCQIEKLVAKDKTAEEDTVAKVLDLSEGIRDSTQQVRDMVAAFRLLVGAANRSVVVTVDLERVLGAAVALTRAAHRHDAVLETEFEPMPPCPGHYVELGSVVVNVLVNAIESLRSSSGPRGVRVQGCVRDDVIEVRIRDTGEGMTQEVLSRAFDPFFTTKDRGQHAGLGLTVARETLVAFDGSIRIESERGKGTTVSIDVPFRQAASIPPPPP